MNEIKRLSEHHKRFVHKFIECGNRAAAYMNVYKNVNDKYTAALNAKRLFDDPLVKAYYSEISEAVTADDIADAHEVLKTFTKIMRREISDIGKDGEPVAPKVSEVMRAGEMLLKHMEQDEDGERESAETGVIIMPEVKEE